MWSSQGGEKKISVWHYLLQGYSLICTLSSILAHNSLTHSNLLGAREDPLLAVYARRISEKIVGLRPPTSAEPFPTIVLAVSIHKEKGKDPEMFGLLVDLLVQLYRDAVTGMQ